ncbi:MAG TPA: Dabb family protein [Candidatus Acidoferrum sp.]|nr:Dabb family protein [Candidatus Acidoferrum sp.]
MTRKPRILGALFVAGALFFAGYAAAQNHFGQPKTVLAISLIKFNPGVSDADAEKVINAIPKMAAQIPGIKNIWIKPARMEPRDFDAAFVIEFVDRAAADRYAESPVHDAWSKQLQQIRLTSISPQITNP